MFLSSYVSCFALDDLRFKLFVDEMAAFKWCSVRAFVPKFRCHGNKGRPHNIVHGDIESAITEYPLVGANISGLSVIQAEL